MRTRAGIIRDQGEALKDAGSFGAKFAAVNFGGGPLAKFLGKLGRLVGLGERLSPIAQKIAGGHAFSKHGAQFAGLGIRNEKQFARFINRIMERPSATRELRNGRTAFWDDATGTVVIHNPHADDAGTAFMPDLGRTYFDEVLK